MDWELVALLLCILVLFACLIATFIFLLRYLGVFGRVEVTVGKPVVKNLWVAYKRHEGSYGECGPFFTEAVSLCPQLSSIAVYYDDPNLVDEGKLRYVVGVILAEDAEEPPQESVTLMKQHNFQVTKFPAIDYAVKAQFPFCFDISARIGSWKVYPALNRFILEQKLSAHPLMELYLGNKIHYMAPLSKQNEFFVPEIKYSVSPTVTVTRRRKRQEHPVDTDGDGDEEQNSESSFEELSINETCS